MSYKSRGNWLMGWCAKTDCKNRNKKCGECVRINGKETEYKVDKKKCSKD